MGANTAGTWSFYADGSDVGLNDASSEEINGVWVNDSVTPNQLYLTTLGNYTVPGGITGNGNDILKFTPSSLGANTSGTYERIWNGDDKGFTTGVMDGMHLNFA